MTFLDILAQTADVCSRIASIAALVILLVKPVREQVMGTKAIREGQRCVLRGLMLSTYYRHKDTDRIRQYEKENFILEYKAYKALGGNSFIDDICKDVRTWDVDS